MDRRTARIVSFVLAALATAAVFLLVTPAGCADVGGLPSWERCTTILGTPAFSVEDLGLDNTFDILPPLIVGVLAGLVSWWAMAVVADGQI